MPTCIDCGCELQVIEYAAGIPPKLFAATGYCCKNFDGRCLLAGILVRVDDVGQPMPECCRQGARKYYALIDRLINLKVSE